MDFGSSSSAGLSAIELADLALRLYILVIRFQGAEQKQSNRRAMMSPLSCFDLDHVQSLKVVISQSAVIATRSHTTVLKTGVQTHMGRDRCAPVFRSVPYRYGRPERRA